MVNKILGICQKLMFCIEFLIKVGIVCLCNVFVLFVCGCKVGVYIEGGYVECQCGWVDVCCVLCMLDDDSKDKD